MQPIIGPVSDSHHVDILVATAMQDEYAALVRLLPNYRVVTPDTLV
jgi:hypothetical protein